MAERQIAFLWVPYFGASVARRAESKLDARPLVLLDEQGRVLQALLDHIGDVVLDQLAQEEQDTTGVPGADDDDGEPTPPPPRRSGSLH